MRARTNSSTSSRKAASPSKPNRIESLNGITLATAYDVTVNGAKALAADVAANNGVIHTIDTVIIFR